MAARKKAPPVNSTEVERRTFVLTKDGNVVELLDGKKQRITEKQLDESLAWCCEGGSWAPRGERYAPKPRVIDWRCEHTLCLNRLKRPGTCRWFVDSSLRVFCAEVYPEASYGPAIYRGEGDNRPMVSDSCRSVAYSPFMTQEEYKKCQQ